MHPDARCPLLKPSPARRFVEVTRLSSLNARHLTLTALAMCTLLVAATAQAAGPEEELLRQQERERALRDQLESRPDVRLQAPTLDEGGTRLPAKEAPCFAINDIRLIGEASEKFQWALKAANPKDDPAVGRCLGGAGINMTMKRMQNAIIEAGYVTTRVLAEAQDLNSGILVLTIVPGRIREIRFAEGTSRRANLWNAMPANPGDLLNLRDIEQALENFKRVPTAEADIQITPARAADAKPGESDVVIKWSQQFPARVSLSVDNSGSKTTGKYQGNVSLSLDNLLSLNDLFYASFNHDLGGGESGRRGSDGNTFHYSLPFGYWQLAFTTSEYNYEQSVAGATQTYQYRGESRNNDLRLSRLLYRDAVRKTTAWGGVWTRSSENFIDDTEIGNQDRRMAGWHFGLDHREFIGASILDLGVAYRRGTGAHDSLQAPEEPSGAGTSRSQIITADAQLQVPFTLSDQRLRYIGGWRSQWNRTPLVPQDRFSIGGRYSVRGFDGENILSADRGWTLRNEIGLALGQTGQELYTGVDYGEVSGQASEFLIGKRLAGAVVGVRGGYKGLSYDWSVGTPLKKPDGFETANVTSAFTVIWSF
ncbi:Hemolysin activation/secretion protein [Pseudomonas cannabina pv. alisalensis]|uniref:Hemolysin activation/secretion protein n=4 Tax=Pseudomonas syringae group TaxID=136849 RepID=A0A3M3PYT9_PSECA|nr:Hemolysin activation/secretion protein [Pseudomonas syringae pv. maculicola]KPW20738.1 Hemolysin activation/secretion protein [Pseudomonas cannabina pv. alisalensis]RMN77084.1 Hemolysin activation/secretion protein [Pseudomonas cannabina]RMN86765.1 Hemolysin activation/secretion protein [Pseudomonas cannabina pv. alisalensis]RMN90521.1 Hemolysin activation/secretion protein [Pseudomonas cannabina]